MGSVSRSWPRGLARAATILLVAVRVAPARATVAKPADCTNPATPPHFRAQLREAIKLSGNLPSSWARSPYLAKIICWQDTGFDTHFDARASDHVWHGIFAMTVQEMKKIAGPWLSNDPNELILNPVCFVQGWDACPHKAANTRRNQQLIAGMRWIWLIYRRPILAWNHIKKTDRLNSYPRPGTDDTSTTHPFSVCPVKKKVTYRDDFGERRTTGGYHPHEGNDIHAPIGRPIRAPFDGLATGHVDTWFAGKSVTVVGAEGFVRNAHLSRFGTLGYVKAGTVIGYVGQTGDAQTPHDHFEWHPWVVPDPLHVAPSGFSRVLDAIDPFPFLNQVCDKA
jgi:hypothetical protein